MEELGLDEADDIEGPQMLCIFMYHTFESI